ncbi:hypothetical protein ACQEUX_24165 [Micromonospora sp. CA-259024]|uniref:hypothetical protein n=1 Tax=Micromonospora sp. CA-259024 TaxID=3239965 RepID=UPI003D923236
MSLREVVTGGRASIRVPVEIRGEGTLVSQGIKIGDHRLPTDGQGKIRADDVWHPRMQIRSRQRVRDLAEVYTHDREVNAMLDLVADMFPSADDPENIDRTFLEPACGHGNFLVEVLRRKLAHVTTDRYGTEEDFEYRILRCFTSTYGIDIFEANVVEARDRMRGVLENHLAGQPVSIELLAAVDAVLDTNIQCADTLADAQKIQLVEYQSVGDGCFLREWSLLQENGQLDLFSKASIEPVRDALPINYTELAKHPGPVHRGSDSEQGSHDA